MNIQDIHKLLEQCDDTEDLAWDGWESGALFTVADKGEEEYEGKWRFHPVVVQEIASGNYYEITTSRTNSGYWGDSERGDTTIRQVSRSEKTIVQVIWRAV